VSVLGRRFPTAELHRDIREPHNLRAEVVVGGWPCQDLSVAGVQDGLGGKNSRLFYELIRYARSAAAETIIAENVLNLVRMERGEVFRTVIRELSGAGFKFIGWRVLNARDFGLPHHRNRVFIIASKRPENVLSLFRKVPKYEKTDENQASGFYWTAGTQSICYSHGYVPTIKIGSTLSIPSAPAVHYGSVVRPLDAQETLKLQGFDLKYFSHIKGRGILQKMAGNAVPVPIGKFVVDGVLEEKSDHTYEIFQQKTLFPEEFFNGVDDQGFFDGDFHHVQTAPLGDRANNLSEFIDLDSEDRLSQKAATGLLRRLERSGQSCPPELARCLEELSKVDA
jgi:DNA (cytosine-5)-methyltransferase 1